MKLCTIIAMAALATTSAAQSITGHFEFGYADRAALSVPKEFSYGNVPYLVLADNNDQNTIQDTVIISMLSQGKIEQLLS